MLTDFISQLYGIHPFVAYLAEAFIFGLLLTLAIFAVSIPAKLISIALNGPIGLVVIYLTEAFSAVFDFSRSMFVYSSTFVARFVELASFRIIFDQHEKQVRAQLSDVQKSASGFPNAINLRGVQLEAALNKLSDRIDGISKLELQAPAPTIPDLKQLQVNEAAHRRALWILIVALLFAPALIVINTFVVNEFFRGFTSLYVYDIPISLVLALFFSAAELMLGIQLYIQQQKMNRADIRSSIAELLLILCLIAFASLEAFFYAVLSAQMDPDILRDLFNPSPVPQWARFWLVPFGPAIVIVLAFTGHRVVEAWDDLRLGASAKALRSQLTAIESAGGRMIEEFEVARGHAKQLTAEAKEYRKELGGGKGQVAHLSEEIHEAIGRLNTTAEEMEKFRREPYAEYSQGDSLRTFYVQVALNCLGILVIILFTYIQFSFWSGHRYLPQSSTVVLIISLVEAGSVLAASYFLSPPVRVASDERDMRIVVSTAESLLAVSSWAVLAAVVAFNGFLIFHNFNFTEWLWFALATTCVATLIYIGRNLGLLLSALWVSLKALAVVVVGMVSAVAGFAMIVIRDVLRIIKGVLAALAYPFDVMMRFFTRGSGSATTA